MSVALTKFVSATASEGEDGSLDYDALWEVVTDAATDSVRTVMLAPLLPKRGDYFTDGTSTDPFSSCRSRQFSQPQIEGTRKLWHVGLKYSTKGSSANPQDQQGGGSDPIDWSWKVSGDGWQEMEAPEKDRNGRPLVNVCAEPFMPPPEREKSYPLLVLTKNHPTLPLGVWSDCQGKVNSNAMWGVGVRIFKLRKWTFEEHWIAPGSMYFSNRLEIQVKWGGHYFQPPNLGFRKKEMDGTGKWVYKEILGKDDTPLSRPSKLSELGSPLEDSDPCLFFDQAAGALQKFELEEEYDFSGILPAVLPGNFI